jgi:hypothetical protein
MGGTISQNIVENEAISMVADIFVNIALFCSSESDSVQRIEILCQPNLPDGNVYENSSTCQQCLKNIQEKVHEYVTSSEILFVKNGVKVMAIDDFYRQYANETLACTAGPSCKACIARNLSQKTTIKSVTNCKAMNNIKNTITQKLMNQITNKLFNNQDVASSIMQMLGANTTNDVITNISTRISDRMTTNIISDIQNNIDANQNITISTSSAKAISQESAFVSVSNYLSTNKVLNNLFTDVELDQINKAINDENTIDSLGNIVVKSVDIFTKLSRSVMGKIVIFVLGMVAILIVAIIIFIIVRLIKARVQADKEKEQIELKNTSDAKVFENF